MESGKISVRLVDSGLSHLPVVFECECAATEDVVEDVIEDDSCDFILFDYFDGDNDDELDDDNYEDFVDDDSNDFDDVEEKEIEKM